MMLVSLLQVQARPRSQSWTQALSVEVELCNGCTRVNRGVHCEERVAVRRVGDLFSLAVACRYHRSFGNLGSLRRGDEGERLAIAVLEMGER